MESNCLWVKGLDALDGTPVLDIKPYPNWDMDGFQSVSDYKVPGWLQRIIKRNLDRQKNR